MHSSFWSIEVQKKHGAIQNWLLLVLFRICVYGCLWLLVKSLDDTEAFECTFTRSICFFCLNVVWLISSSQEFFLFRNKHFFLVFYIFIMHKHFFCTWRYSALMEVYLNNSKLNNIFIIVDALPYLGLQKNKEIYNDR